MTKRNPFTLVELLTTITILAVLAGIALGVTKLVFTKAHESKNQAVIKMIEIALEQYKTKYGYYPNITRIQGKLLSVSSWTGWI